MGLRIQALLVSVFTAFAAVYASALGLGEIKLNSALNQPLDAEIRLLQVRDLTEKEIIVGLASQEEFQRLGIERPHFLTDLSFSVDLNASTGPVVKVTTLKPIREPFLDFIVQAQWPSGKLLREYTLLIDLPVFSGDQPAPAATPPARTAPEPARRPEPVREVPRDEPAPADTGRPGVSERPADPVAPADPMSEYGPVAPNENLWGIATRSRPDSSVTVQQTMLAIQRLNPQAFIDENINLLRRGEVLRLPSKDDILALDNREAIQRVAEQNQAWNERAAAAKAQLQGTRTDQPRQETPPQPEGRVKLTTPTEATGEAAQGTGDSDASASAEAKEAELAIAQEQFDAARRERSEIRSRRAAIDAQAETLERLLEISNEELRVLELAATQMNEADRAADETGSPTQETPEEPEATQSEGATQVQQENVPTFPEAEPTPTSQSKSFVDVLMDNLLYIGLALGAVLIGVALFLYMRGRDEGFDDDDFDSLPEDFAGMNFDDAEDVDVQEDDNTVVLAADGTNDEDKTEVMETEALSREAETEDVVAECDIHIAYGQYEQAEEKLTAALEREPHNTAVHLKLLEVYAAQQDGERFDAAYARLRVLDNPESMERAQSLRETIQGLDPFDDQKHDVSTFRALLAGSSGAALAGTSGVSDDDGTGSGNVDDDPLDFDLDLDNSDGSLDDLDTALALDEDETEDKTVFAPRGQDVSTEEELDLDFDLNDLDDLDQTDLDDADAFLQSEEGEVASTEGVDFDLDEDFDGTLDGGEDGGTLAEKVSADAGGEGLVLDEDDLADYGADTPFSPGIEETDFLNMDGDELDLVSGEKDELEVDLTDDFNLDDLDHDLDELAGSFDGDFEDLEASSNDETIEPLATVADEFTGDFSEMQESETDDFDEVDEAAEPDEIEMTDDVDADSVAAAENTPEPPEFELPEIDPEEDDDTNLGFLSDSDETATKLDLARAYIDMGDADGAKDILDEILEEGDNDQRKEAETLMAKLG